MLSSEMYVKWVVDLSTSLLERRSILLNGFLSVTYPQFVSVSLKYHSCPMEPLYHNTQTIENIFISDFKLTGAVALKQKYLVCAFLNL